MLTSLASIQLESDSRRFGNPNRFIPVGKCSSPHVLPKPRDSNADVAVTGYWFLDTPDWSPDGELAAFLAAGEPPIYVGFGSMPGVDRSG